MKMKLHKMQGCGNDFLFLDFLGSDDMTEFRKNEVRFLCDRHFGVGADGFVILRPPRHPEHSAAWNFFNSDGSVAEMCGNAARCAMRFLAEKIGLGEGVLSLETSAGVIKGQVIDDKICEITMFSEGDLKFDYTEKVLSTEKNVFTAFCINTGVSDHPHCAVRDGPRVATIYS